MADALTDNWVYNDLEMTVDLLKGNNEITVNVQGNEENNAPTVLLDHIAVELEPGYTVYQDEVFESVNGSYSSKNDDVVAGKLYTGNSAMNFIGLESGPHAKVTVSAAAAGTYNVRLRISAPTDFAENKAIIFNETNNKTAETTLGDGATGVDKWGYVQMPVELAEGNNT